VRINIPLKAFLVNGYYTVYREALKEIEEREYLDGGK
jgi:hypothetical protein